MYDQMGMYGYNPNYTLAETPYARMTGLFTPINKQQIPNANSYLQPIFLDMNPYMGNNGIPSYPSFIGGMAMQNPNIPIIQPNQIGAWQQQYQNYPQQSYYQQPQQGYYQQPQQPQMIYNNQQVFYGQQPPQPPQPPQSNFFTSFINCFQQAFSDF